MTALFRDEKCSQSTDVGQPTKHSNVPDEATKKKTTAAALSSPRAIDPVALRDFPEESEAEGRDRMHSVTEEEIMNHRRRALPAGGTDKEGGEALVAEASERAARASQSHLLTHTELQARANRDARKHQSELAAQEKRKFTKRMAAKKKEQQQQQQQLNKKTQQIPMTTSMTKKQPTPVRTKSKAATTKKTPPNGSSSTPAEATTDSPLLTINEDHNDFYALGHAHDEQFDALATAAEEANRRHSQCRTKHSRPSVVLTKSAITAATAAAAHIHLETRRSIAADDECVICHRRLLDTLKPAGVEARAASMRPRRRNSDALRDRRDAQVCTLECGHSYHAWCVEEFLLMGVTSVCPICRCDAPPSVDKSFDDAYTLYFPVKSRVQRK